MPVTGPLLHGHTGTRVLTYFDTGLQTGGRLYRGEKKKKKAPCGCADCSGGDHSRAEKAPCGCADCKEKHHHEHHHGGAPAAPAAPVAPPRPMMAWAPHTQEWTIMPQMAMAMPAPAAPPPRVVHHHYHNYHASMTGAPTHFAQHWPQTYVRAGGWA